jgi:hypothetical protein
VPALEKDWERREAAEKEANNSSKASRSSSGSSNRTAKLSFSKQPSEEDMNIKHNDNDKKVIILSQEAI